MLLTTQNTSSPSSLTLEPPAVLPAHTHNCVATLHSNTIKCADDTAVVGLITDEYDKAQVTEVEDLMSWCQDNNLLLDLSKT